MSAAAPNDKKGSKCHHGSTSSLLHKVKSDFEYPVGRGPAPRAAHTLALLVLKLKPAMENKMMACATVHVCTCLHQLHRDLANGKEGKKML